MSLSAPKNNIKNSYSTRIHRKKKRNVKELATEECKKLYQKYYSYPSSSLLNQLNENIIKIYLENLKLKDITVLTELLSKYFYFQQIEISPSDPNKQESTTTRRKYREPILTEEEKSRIEKDKKIKQRDLKNMLNKLIICISKHISISKSIISLSLNNIELNQKYCQYLSKGIVNNKSLQSLSITNTKIILNSYELLLGSLLNHKSLLYLDLSNNNFEDKYGKMISRLIIRHSQKRDQVVWSYGLRNELPLTNDYKKGLIFINLNGNHLSRDSADSISNALYSDQYIRAIYLNNNNFDKYSCKKFIYMMRKNLTLLTIDLRENPGYDNAIHSRFVMKMSKNIRYLYQQYKKGEYTEEEFENFKIFIDITFFDVDIPQNVVDFYNNNLPETIEINDNNENKENKETISEKKNKNDIEENKNIIDTNTNANILEENKKLYNENLRLKQQIIELKAKNLQQKLGGDKNKINNIETHSNNNNKNKNNESKDDIENDYLRVELLVNELNELMNKIEKKKSQNNVNQSKEKEKEKEYKTNKDNNNIANNENMENKNNKNMEIKKEENNKYTVIKEIIIDTNDNKENKENKEKEKEKDINKNKDLNNNKKEIENGNTENNIIKTNKRIDDDTKNNINNNNINNINNNIINKEEVKNNHENEEQNDEKDKESSDSHFVDENGNVYNIDDLSEEEKMIILQQQLILQRLQEEAEARGEQFDPQEYIEFLEKQAKEEEEEELNGNNSSNKLNKSF